MAGRKVFTSGEILTASDVNSFLMDQVVAVFADSTARSSAIPTPTEGMVTYVEDANRVEVYDGSAFGPIGGILQVVRATDVTKRSTTSTSFVDVPGMSVTITPQNSNSEILILALFSAKATSPNSGNQFGRFRITDSSNVSLSGAEESQYGLRNIENTTSGNVTLSSFQTMLGFNTPATTSTVTYKLRFLAETPNNTISVQNDLITGQMFAIEVAA